MSDQDQKTSPNAPHPPTAISDDRTRSAYAIGVSGYFGALFLIYGVHLPYFPVWLDWRGLTAGEIAIIVAVPYLVRFIASPLIALWSDRQQGHRRATIALGWLALAAALMLTQVASLWPVLLASLALALAMTSVMPLAETIAVRGVLNHRLDYGQMRLWGSLTFIVASLGGGHLIDVYGAWIGIWLIVAACAVTTAAAYALPRASRTGPCPAPSKEPRTETSQTQSALKLLASVPFLLLIVATGCAQAGHATYYTFGTLHWLSQGITPLQAGLLWAIGVLAEILLFAKSRFVFAKVSALTLLICAGAAAVVRWAIMAFDPPFAALIGLQVLHGLTFGAAHLAAIHLVGIMVPDKLQGTGQALHASVGMGLAMGAAMLLSGHLYAAYAGWAYMGMAALGAVALIAAILLARSWDGRVIDLGRGK